MHLRRGGIFNGHLIANLLMSLLVQLLLKSIMICQSYEQKYMVLFFDSRGRYDSEIRSLYSDSLSLGLSWL